MRKSSFTLPARSLVLTTDGFKKAADIDTGDFIIDVDGYTHPVTEIGNGGPLNCASVLIGNDERHQLSGDEILVSRFSKNDNGVMSMEQATHKCPHDLKTPEAAKFIGIPNPPFADIDEDEEPPSFDYVCSPNVVTISDAFDVPEFTDYELWLLGLYASNGTSSTYVTDNERTAEIEFNADDRVAKDLLLLRHVESMSNEASKTGIKTETTPDMEHARFSSVATDEKTFAYKVAQMYGPVAGSRQICALVPDEYCIDWTSDSIGIPVGTMLLDDDKLDRFLEGYCQDFAPLGGVPRSSGVPCRSLADALMLRLLIHKRYGCRAFLRHGGHVTVADGGEYSDVIPAPSYTYDMWFVSFDSTDADGAEYANAFDGDKSYMTYCITKAGTERTSDDCVEVVVEGSETVIQDSLIVFGEDVSDDDVESDDDVIEFEEIVETVTEDDGIDDATAVIDDIDVDDDDNDIIDGDIDGDDDLLNNDNVTDSSDDENTEHHVTNVPAAIKSTAEYSDTSC